MTPYKPELLAIIEKHFGQTPEVRTLSKDIEIAIVTGREDLSPNESKVQVARDYRAIFTLGMSAHAMKSGRDETWKFAELVLLLPLDWPLEMTPQNWPIWWLERLATMPRRLDTHLGLIHTVPNGEPAQPFAPDVPFCAWFLISPIELPRQFARLKMRDGEILNLLTPVALYKDELSVKINKGTGGLLELLTRANVSDLFDPARPSVFAPKPRKKLFGR